MRAHHLEVTNVDGDVLRFGDFTQHMDDLETLAQFDAVTQMFEGAGTASMAGVHDIGSTSGGREDDRATIERHVAFRIHGVQRHPPRGRGEGLLDQAAVDPNDQRRFIHGRAADRVTAARLGGQNLDPLVLEDLQRGHVKAGHLIIRENPLRSKWIL